MQHSRLFNACATVVLALSACLWSGASRAAVLTVGAGSGCSHTTIQAAVNAANGNGVHDEIRITRSAQWLQQGIVINTNEALDLIGGYANCTSAQSDGVHTIIDGQGGSAASVLRITGNANIRISTLRIQGGDPGSTGQGGGIYYKGNGSLTVSFSNIVGNSAGTGGGIYAEGTGTNARLVIGYNALIGFNKAARDGGGVAVVAMKMSMLHSGSTIHANEAGVSGPGAGGGLYLLSGARPAEAEVASAGVGSLATINSNSASNGGGIALIGGSSSSHPATLKFYSISGVGRASIRGNRTTGAGGGILLYSGNQNAPVVVGMWHADIVDNRAFIGPAASIRPHASAAPGSTRLTFNTGVAPAGTQACGFVEPCGRIANNRSQVSSGTPASQGVVSINPLGSLEIDRAALVGNSGGELIWGGGNNQVTISTSLLADNNLDRRLVSLETGTSDLVLRDITAAGNVVFQPVLFSVARSVELRRSIVFQPGTVVLNSSTRAVDQVLTHDGSGLFGPTIHVLGNPRFVNPAAGNYQLQASSYAIDRTIGPPGGTDLLGRLRNAKLSHMLRPPEWNRDLGAFERQSFDPLVLNGDFASDLTSWTNAHVTSGGVQYDGSQDFNGSAYSGSAKVRIPLSSPGHQIPVLKQCIYLPAPGTYELNGAGKSVGADPQVRDTMILQWEFRRHGGIGYDCDSGAPDANGMLLLGNSADWHRPSRGATIAAPPGQWTEFSSVVVHAVIHDRGTSQPAFVEGWFDHITLNIVEDTIFRNGFQP